MSIDEYLAELESLMMARASLDIKIELLKKRRKLELQADTTDKRAPPFRPQSNSPSQQYAIDNNVWPEAKELLQHEEVGWKHASEFLGFDVEFEHLVRPDCAEQNKLRRLLQDNIIRNGPSSVPGAKNTYCTISLVEYVTRGEEAIRNAQANSQQERNMDPDSQL